MKRTAKEYLVTVRVRAYTKEAIPRLLNRGKIEQVVPADQCPDCGGECDNLLATLKLSLEALDTSEPKQKHYPEPVARHKKATVSVAKAIDKLASKQRIYPGHQPEKFNADL